jgi:hypothetical protein
MTLPDATDRVPPRRDASDARWRWLVAALLIGVLISWAWSAGSARSANEPAIVLLGSGNGLSVLVTTGDARVLVAGGTSAGDFANALADARPRTTPRIDVLVALPGSRNVVDRARELARPTLELRLPDQRSGRQESGTLTSRRAIDLPGITIDIDPGSGSGEDWSITIRAGASTTLVVPAWTVAASRAPVALVVITGRDTGAAATTARTPAIAASVRALDSPVVKDGLLAGRVAPGDAVRLRMSSDGALAVPAAWQANPAS